MSIINFNFFQKTNENLFIKLNNSLNFFSQPAYELINLVLDFHYFYFHILIYLLIVIKKLKKRLTNINLDSLFQAQQSIVYITLNLLLVLAIKNHFSFTRPFCNTEITHIIAIKPLLLELDCLQSFPSGHTTYIASILFIFWARANIITRIILLSGLTLIAMTRIAAGAHYPSDIIGAIIISYLMFIFCFRITAFYKKPIFKINRFFIDKINFFLSKRQKKLL